MRIAYVIDTHIHADHISGARRLAEQTGAQVVVHRSAAVRYPHLAADDGDLLDMANVKVRVLHTPGHTPEHISLVVEDHSRSGEPWFVLTGHTLMVGDGGRPDLAADPAEGAAQLYRSLFEKFAHLPDEVEVYPGAFAGSVCGKALSGKPSSTLGFERRHNQAMRLKERDAFVRYLVNDIPPRPPLAEEMRAYNMGLRAEMPV